MNKKVLFTTILIILLLVMCTTISNAEDIDFSWETIHQQASDFINNGEEKRPKPDKHRQFIRFSWTD